MPQRLNTSPRIPTLLARSKMLAHARAGSSDVNSQSWQAYQPRKADRPRTRLPPWWRRLDPRPT